MKYYLALVVCFFTISSYAGWSDMNTGINDNLTGVVFSGSNGFVSGHKGIYYTTNGGLGPASWTRFDISGNTADSITYNNSRFNHCFNSNAISDYAVFCGEDTVNNLAVIMELYLPTLSYQILYVGAPGSSLNNIGYSSITTTFYAVGANGLIVQFAAGTSGSTTPSGVLYDLNAIHFRGTAFVIGANNNVLTGVDNNPGLTINFETLSSGDNFEDVFQNTQYQLFGVGSGHFLLNQQGFVNAEYFNYSGGSLNAQGLYHFNGYQFVGTDHGIYRANGSSFNILEYQSTSLGLFINDFFGIGSKIYACGPNGILLSSTDSGGITTPFTQITGSGGCVNTYLIFQSESGTSTSCNWFIDNVQVSSNCNAMGNTFTVTGSYEIKFIASSSGGADTSILIINIVEPPEINYSFSISDSILCHEESIDISIDTSQFDVQYTLYDDQFNTTYGTSSPGNQSSLYFTSDLISNDGYYFIQAQSTIANCTADFMDTIFIDVEKTKAKYHSSLLNAYVDEAVPFFENCVDSDNYLWSFSPNATPSNSGAADPSVSFGVNGGTTVNLISWSNNGCYDTITGPGPMIVTANSPSDSCWINQMDSPDWTWNYNYEEDVIDMQNVDDGYVVIGHYEQATLATQYGDSLELPLKGTYLAKYDNHGLLRWVIKDEQNTPLDDRSFKSVVIDNQGNIIVCGYSFPTIFDNEGDSTNTVATGKVIKFSPTGKLLWHIHGYWDTYEVSVDNSNNVIVASIHTSYSPSTVQLNNAQYFTLNQSLNLANRSVTMFDSTGVLVWDVPMKGTITIKKMGSDDLNSVYVTGEEQSVITIHPVNNPSGMNIPSSPVNGKSMFVFKFDSLGNYIWNVVSYSQGAVDGTRPEDMEVTSNGDCYISGINDAGSEFWDHVFINANGTEVNTPVGNYFLAKINSDGIHQWSQGTTYSGSNASSRIDLRNDSIFVAFEAPSGYLGSIRLNNPDGSYFQYNNLEAFYLVARYDTVGFVHEVIYNGADMMMQSSYGIQGFIRKGESYYMAQNIFMAYAATEIVNFGDTVYQTKKYDGWVNKFSKPCASELIMMYEYVTDTNVCMGVSYTFPGGNTEIINTITYDTLSFTSLLGADSSYITIVNPQTPYSLVLDEYVCSGSVYDFPDGSSQTITASLTQVSNMLTTLGCDSIITTNVIVAFPSVADHYVQDCEAITSPSGNYIYSSTGTFADTISNVYGCDSVITVYFTRLQETFATLNIIECEEYYSPSGVYYYSYSGIFNDTIVNAAGCDSVLTLNVNIIEATDTLLYVYECATYTSPNGNTVTSSTTLWETIPNAEGCDSNMVIVVSITPPSSQYVTLSSCDQYTAPSGTQVWTSSGTYTDTLINIGGCDSVIFFDLTIFNSSNEIINASICSGATYTSPSGNFIWSTPGVYYDTILTSQGCDSSFTINLQASFPTSSSMQASACDSYTGPSGNTWYSSGVFTDVIPNSTGCDSVITIDLTITNIVATVVQIDNVTLSGITQQGNSIQWVSCDFQMQPILGETSSLFTATYNGSYAIIASDGVCLDTSACIELTVGMDELSNSGFSLQPNPVEDYLTLTFETIESVDLELYDATGRLVKTFRSINSNEPILMVDIERGVYYLRLITELEVMIPFVKM